MTCIRLVLSSSFETFGGGKVFTAGLGFVGDGGFSCFSGPSPVVDTEVVDRSSLHVAGAELGGLLAFDLLDVACSEASVFFFVFPLFSATDTR